MVIVLSSLTSGGDTHGIALSSIDGPVTVSAGAISGFSGTGVSVSSGTGTVTSAASVTAAGSARSVNVSNHSTGTVTLSGNVTDNGVGVQLDNNDTAPVHLTGLLTLATGSSTAFNAVKGGTVSAPNVANAATTTTGKAVNVDNTTIHSNGIKFGNVTSNGTVTISNNNVANTEGNGILVTARDANGTLSAKIQNNLVAAPLEGVRQGIRVDSGNGTSGEHEIVCLNIAGNTSAGSTAEAKGIGLRRHSTGTNVFGIHGMSATSTPGVEAYVDGINPAGGGTLLISATTGFSNCSLP